MDGVDMLRLVNLLLEGSSTNLANKRPLLFMGSPHVSQKAIMKRKRRCALRTFEVSDLLMFRLDVLGKVSLFAETRRALRT